MHISFSPLAAVTMLLYAAIAFGNDYLVTLTDGNGRHPLIACDTDMDCQIKNPWVRDGERPVSRW